MDKSKARQESAALSLVWAQTRSDPLSSVSLSWSIAKFFSSGNISTNRVFATLRDTINQASRVNDVLFQTADRLGHMNTRFNDVSKSLNMAQKSLSRLHGTISQSDKYIWLAFYTFLCVSAYIAASRLGIVYLVKLTITTLYRLIGYCLSFWSGEPGYVKVLVNSSYELISSGNLTNSTYMMPIQEL